MKASDLQISVESGLNIPKSSWIVASASTAKPKRTSFSSARTGCARSSSDLNLREYHSASLCDEEPIMPRMARFLTVAHAGKTFAKKVDLPQPGGALITAYSSYSVSIRRMMRSVASICHGCRTIPKYRRAKISILSYAALASGLRSSYDGTPDGPCFPRASFAAIKLRGAFSPSASLHAWYETWHSLAAAYIECPAVLNAKYCVHFSTVVALPDGMLSLY